MALVAAGAVLIGCGCTKLPPQPEVQSEDRAPSWSPDGQWIAYVHFDSNPRDTLDVGGIYITNVAGTVKRLVIGSPSARSVDWSPDSRWLVFNDALGLHVIKADGESLRTIYSGGSFPSWSPDGREIAFSTTIQVWGIHPDGTGLHEITPAGPPYGGDADWSPDGMRVVILGNTGSVGEEVFIFRLMDSVVVRLTNDDHEERSPAWSPRGDRIAWCPILARSELWVMDTLGTNKRRLAIQGLGPAWDPTGRTIVFMNGSLTGGRLFTINVDGTGLRQVTR